MRTTHICRINASEAFVLPEDMGVGYPMAPMTSVRWYEKNSQDMLEVRIIVFIDVNNSSLIQVANVLDGDDLSLTVKYRRVMPDGVEPNEFAVWLIECHYPLPEAGAISTVTTILENDDPKTSRGTVTSVPKVKA